VNRREFLGLAAVAPFALRSSGTRGPLALVTCDFESRLAVVDLASRRVVRHIATPPGPRSVELVGRRAVVAHWDVGSLSVVDVHGVRHVVEGVDAPRYTAAHPDGIHAFVTDSGRGIVVLDAVRGRVVGRLKLPDWPRHITRSPDGRLLWVGLGTASSHVAVVDVSDPLRPMRVALVAPPFGAHDVGFTPDGGHVWVTSGDAGATALYRASGSLVARHPADAAPQHVTFGHGVAYVTSGDAGTFRVLSQDGARMLRETRVPRGSYNVQYGRGSVLTPSLDDGTLTVLDVRGNVLASVRVAQSCHDACFARV
jgi:DNA-binding beta-propeller fold protein YncE